MKPIKKALFWNPSSIPSKLPIRDFFIILLIYFNDTLSDYIPQWAWGIIWLVWIIWLGLVIYQYNMSVYINPFEEPLRTSTESIESLAHKIERVKLEIELKSKQTKS